MNITKKKLAIAAIFSPMGLGLFGCVSTSDLDQYQGHNPQVSNQEDSGVIYPMEKTRYWVEPAEVRSHSTDTDRYGNVTSTKIYMPRVQNVTKAANYCDTHYPKILENRACMLQYAPLRR